MSLTNIKPAEFYERYWTDEILEAVTPDLRFWEIEDDEFCDYYNDKNAELLGPWGNDLPPWHIKRRWRYEDSEELEFYRDKNSIEENEKLIKDIEEKLDKLTHNKLRKGNKEALLTNFFHNSLIDCLEKIAIIKTFFPKFLFTQQLYKFEFHYIPDMKNILQEAINQGELFRSIDDLHFNDFSLNNDKIIEQIKKSANWHHIKRDLEIYKLKKDHGKDLKEIGDLYGIKFNTVSTVVTKVQGEINRIKGKLFEKFVYERLKISGLFDEVKWGGDIGEADVLAYQKEDLYIYSLKNLQIDRSPYWLIISPKNGINETPKGELKPEIEFAKLSYFDYETHLILLIYDNFHDKCIQTEIDYADPKNLDLTKL